MVVKLCVIQLKNSERAVESMLMLGLIEIVDHLAIAHSVR